MPTIRIQDDVAARLRELARPNESPNSIIRRVLGLQPYAGLRQGYPVQPGDLYAGRTDAGHVGWLVKVDHVTDREIEATVLEAPHRRRGMIGRRHTYSAAGFRHGFRLAAAINTPRSGDGVVP